MISKILKISLVSVYLLFATIAVFPVSANAATGTCQPGNSFLGLPTWYKYLDGQTIQDGSTGGDRCQPVLNGINDVWKIVAAVIDLLLRLASLIAIGFILYGGFMYITSQGSPDKTKQAQSTIISALVGMVIAITAATIIGFVAGRFRSTPATPTNPQSNTQQGPR